MATVIRVVCLALLISLALPASRAASADSARCRLCGRDGRQAALRVYPYYDGGHAVYP